MCGTSSSSSLRWPSQVVGVVMTDRRFQRQPVPGLLALIEETDPSIRAVDFHDLSTAPKGAEGALFRLLPLLRGGRDRHPQLVAQFSQLLAAAKPEALE